MATEERREEKQRSDAGGQHAATENPPHTAYSLLGKQTPTADLKRGLCAIPTGSSAYLGTYTCLQDTTVLEEFRVIRIIPTISLAANLGEAINKSKGTQSIQQCAGTDPKGLQCCGGGGTAQSDSTAWHQNLGPQGLRAEDSAWPSLSSTTHSWFFPTVHDLPHLHLQRKTRTQRAEPTGGKREVRAQPRQRTQVSIYCDPTQSAS